jgi:integration host factor subunit beta
MIKSEFIEHVTAKMPSLGAKHVAEGVNEILDLLSQALLKKQRVEVRGMGSFDLRFRAPRNAHNPKTGEKVVTESKYSVHFKPGLELRQRVNDSKARYPLPKDE